MKFWGFVRENGKVGIRNHVLVVGITRNVATLAYMIAGSVRGTRLYAGPNENGRSRDDRETMARVITGLAKNPNVGGVLLVGNKPDGGYAEFTYENIVENIMASGKPVETLFISRDGGHAACIGLGIQKARRLAELCSAQRREEVDWGKLCLAVKCGYSDATSGMAGNPVVGYVFDRLCDAGGTAIFSETTEVIGAEDIVARRFADAGQRATFLACVRKVEEEARATGQDIRSINPIPANIEAGLTTLEEKSLGAIAKAGSKPIMQCVRYGESPSAAGLNYMDSWMSSSALFAGFSSAGAVLNIFQFGGGDDDPGRARAAAQGPDLLRSVLDPEPCGRCGRDACLPILIGVDFDREGLSGSDGRGDRFGEVGAGSLDLLVRIGTRSGRQTCSREQ